MPVETPSIFSKIIEEHLELKRRNAELEGDLPLSRYVHDDPFQNHPLFKTEEQARLEETMDGTEPAVVRAGRDRSSPRRRSQAWTEAVGRAAPPRARAAWPLLRSRKTTACGAAPAISTGATDPERLRADDACAPAAPKGAAARFGNGI